MRPHCIAQFALIAITFLSVTGCRTGSPLRPGQEATTGGRTALTQWEFFDAVTQMYETQALLNVVRIAEYGESPVHFEFSNILATVTDGASASVGLNFVDSPTGVTTVGNRVIPIVDTPVTFTPNLSGSRSVGLQATATPVTRKNWIYGWYYQAADTQLSRNEKFYQLEKPEGVDGGIRVMYRGKTYYANPARVDELGALTAIVSFLEKSDANEGYRTRSYKVEKPTSTTSGFSVTVPAPAEGARLIQAKHAKQLINELPTTTQAVLRFPTKRGERFEKLSFSLDTSSIRGLAENIASGTETTIKLIHRPANAAKRQQERAAMDKKIAQYNELVASGRLAAGDRMALVFETQDPTAQVDLVKSARTIAGSFVLEQTVEEKTLLQEIVKELRELNLQEQRRATRTGE